MMQYPLQEKIGLPELLVGRAREFANFQQWLDNMPRKLSKSRAILARRKSGKTVFIQRLFNELWNTNGQVIPFYFEFAENKIWLPELAIKYYCAFVSQYISFIERDAALVQNPLTLAEIRDYGVRNALPAFVRDVEQLETSYALGRGMTLMWDTASSAPHRYADLYDRRVLVILDEFQNITKFVYRDEKGEGQPDDTLAGSYHSLAESKIAPMLVTGSYIGWLESIISKYLEAGRLSIYDFNPYLTPEEGLEAVYRYAKVYQKALTNETALQINALCMADPFFIACVIQSGDQSNELTTTAGVVNTVNYEITDRKSEMSRTWAEYIVNTLERINDRNAKKLLLYLSKNADRYWTPRELKEALHLDLTEYEIQDRLISITESDLLVRGPADIDFRGLHDGTLNLILRSRFEKEINNFVPDIRQEFVVKIAELQQENRRLRGMLNHLSGRLAENLLANELKARKRIRLADYFPNLTAGEELNLIDVRERVTFQRADGKGQEIDVLAQADDGRVLLVEVRKRQEKMGLTAVSDFRDKANAYAQQFPQQVVFPAFLALGGFTAEAQHFCNQQGIGMAEQIVYLWAT